MKIHYVILPSIAIGTAAALFLPARTEAFTTIGGSLSTSQRDLRVFDNFTDASANNNTAPHPNFPGFTGAEMAIWKGALEWSSRPHGDGTGDPGQGAGLGSGGANFDAVWAGNATSSGGTNDNVCSELLTTDNSVLAFTETPISDGWRILFIASPWVWQDGPSQNVGSGNNIDIQGIMCHEYGHALGLGHTGVAGSTMLAGAAGSGSNNRSIEADDIAGVQFIYGVALVSKPIITGVSTSPGMVTITGSSFGATGNQVWFCPNVTTAPAGDPVVKALNVSSSGGGTSITAAVPANAGPGDVFVKLSTAGNGTLSNGWPFNPQAVPPCPQISTFCLAAGNSYAPGGAICDTTGSQSIAANDLRLLVVNVPPNKLGLFFYGMDMSPLVTFGNGWRCIGSPFFRLTSTTSGIFGDVDFALDHNNLPFGGTISAGETWGFQFWYRDPDAGGANFNASDGVAVPFCP